MPKHLNEDRLMARITQSTQLIDWSLTFSAI